jgi:uncharacterized membrane protein YoaK (UPF0700 family)
MGVQSALVRLLVQGSPSTNVMTTNTTQFAIDTTELVLAWSSKRSAPTDTRPEAEHAEMLRRWTKHWSVLLGFFLGTLTGAGAYVRLDCGAYCCRSRSSARCWYGRQRPTKSERDIARGIYSN